MIQKASLFTMCMFATFLVLSSCSSPEENAAKLISSLPDSDCVVYTNLIGDSKMVITSELEKDSTVTIKVHDIEKNHTDSIINLIKDCRVWETLPLGNDSYLIVTSLPPTLNNENGQNLFCAHIIRNSLDKKASSITQLYVDESNKNLAATGYTLDKDRRKLTLTSYDWNTKSATIYLAVFDFDGNRLLSDSIVFDLKQQNESENRSNEIGIWECQKCHQKRNSKKKPSIFEFTCHGNGEPDGFGNSHQWVKIGSVN